MADAPTSRWCPAHPHRHAADPERRRSGAPQSAGTLWASMDNPHWWSCPSSPGGSGRDSRTSSRRSGPPAARGDRLAAPVQRPRYRPGPSGPADVHRRGRAAAGDLLRCDISAVAGRRQASPALSAGRRIPGTGPCPCAGRSRRGRRRARTSPRRYSCPRCTTTSRRASFPRWLTTGESTCCAAAIRSAVAEPAGDRRAHRDRSAGRPAAGGPARHGQHRAGRPPHPRHDRTAGQLAGRLPGRSRRKRLTGRKRS